MSAEEPRTEAEPPPPEPAPQAPAAPTVSPAAPAISSRVLVVVAAIVVLAVAGFLIAQSGLLRGSSDEPAYTVQAYTPPEPLMTSSERVLARAEPDAASPTVVMFGQGVAVEVTGRVSRGLGNDWYQISWNNQHAYIRQQDTVPGDGAPPPMQVRERPPPVIEEKPKDEDEIVADFPDVEPAPRAISEVVWARRPSARDYNRFYPRRALDAGQSGRVVLDCTANARGALSCSVAEESPPGWGFGEAALRIARQSRIEPQMSDGTSAAGQRVRMPLAFQAD